MEPKEPAHQQHGDDIDELVAKNPAERPKQELQTIGHDRHRQGQNNSCPGQLWHAQQAIRRFRCVHPLRIEPNRLARTKRVS